MPSGRWPLYWPHELFDSKTKLVHPLHPDIKLPLKPLEDGTNPVLNLCCHPLTREENSTSETKTTMSRVAKNAMDLEEIRLAPDLLDNLETYAKRKAPDPLPTYLPSTDAQSKSLTRISRWFLHHCVLGSEDTVVGTEDAVRMQVYNQLIMPVNYLLQSRYSDKDIRWRSSNLKEKINMARSKGKSEKQKPGDKRNRSGDADFLIPSGAICEVKTWWSISAVDIATIFIDTAFTSKGQIKSFSTDKHCELITQIWTELQNHNCQWGFFVNGEVVVIFCKTAEHQLSISLHEEWTSIRLHSILMGLSSVAEDYSSMIHETNETAALELLNDICGTLIWPFNGKYTVPEIILTAKEEWNINPIWKDAYADEPPTSSSDESLTDVYEPTPTVRIATVANPDEEPRRTSRIRTRRAEV